MNRACYINIVFTVYILCFAQVAYRRRYIAINQAKFSIMNLCSLVITQENKFLTELHVPS